MRTMALLCFVPLALGGCQRSGEGAGALTRSAVTTGAERVPQQAAPQARLLQQPAPQARAPQQAAPQEPRVQPREPVEFTWRSGFDASKGRIEAMLPDGRVFRGKYAQVRSADVEFVGDYYGIPGDRSWVGSAVWATPPERIVSTYTNQAVAKLESPDGTQMRCEFKLRKPVRGMAGGGVGDCLLSDQQAIVDAKLSKD